MSRRRCLLHGGLEEREGLGDGGGSGLLGAGRKPGRYLKVSAVCQPRRRGRSRERLKGGAEVGAHRRFLLGTGTEDNESTWCFRAGK